MRFRHKKLWVGRMHYLEVIEREKSFSRNIAVHEFYPAKMAEYCDFPEFLNHDIVTTLRRKGINRLYSHQAEAVIAVSESKNIVVTSGVASGKSLCYFLPVINNFIKSEAGKSLFIFPTKALTQDQKTNFSILLNEIAISGCFEKNPVVGVYDGDTENQKRSQIKQSCDFLFTNPDMLHMGILPQHPKWLNFFKNLRFIVIDEAHYYRGVFGSHFANIIRRLMRICRHYGANPQFIVTSATLANAKDFVEKLLQTKFHIVEEDGSQQGEKHFYIYNPPLVNEELGIRRSSLKEVAAISRMLMNTDSQTLIFSESRRSVELLLAEIRKHIKDKDLIKGYRSGYLPVERRNIEKRLREKSLRAVISTNALELGIDIGGLDSVIINGYPGSITSTKQQSGRAGRGDRPSQTILVANSGVLNQFIVRHPEYILENSPEEALINPDNPLILLSHLQCALYEIPFRKGENFGTLPFDEVNKFLVLLQKQNKLFLSGEKYFWKSAKYPASELSLRTAGIKPFVIECENSGSFSLHSKPELIGIVDKESALWMTHPEAIYLQDGEQYFVEKLDLENYRVVVSLSDSVYYTQASSKTDITLLKKIKEDTFTGFKKNYGQIKAVTQVTGYKKIDWQTNEILGYGEVELPPTELITFGFWFTFEQDLTDKLKELQIWNNQSNDYGSDWGKIKQRIKIRDEGKCRNCGRGEGIPPLQVHHIIPFRSFRNTVDANREENLITLCPSCHHQAEQNVMIQSLLSGLANLIRNIAPFYLMSDIRDIRVSHDNKAEISDGLPMLIVYDSVPGGIGLSERLYDLHSALIDACLEIVETCTCKDGCPDCTGAVAENGVGVKNEAKMILKMMQESR
ncbi:MAG: DEAD/DEAH box helicase [Candidatus Cloacimonetes bacterium]|nr:DEAD/DEAH box helicase [Candidatus Cloacimonadota bacterium]